MFDLVKQKRTYRLVLPLLILLTALVWAAVFFTPNNQLKIVFCDVGQGDATIISRGLTQILIDGGPDDRVIGCLGKYLPFYDRKIEAVILTHPEADHYTGLIPVLKKYQVGRFITGPATSEDPAYKQLVSLISSLSNLSNSTNWSNLTNHQPLFAGDVVRFGNYRLEIVWPEKAWAEESLKVTNLLAQKPALNKFSLFMVLQKLVAGNLPADLSADKADKAGWQSVVALAGDADSLVQPLFNLNYLGDLNSLKVLKFPHHGSKTGMTEDFLKILNPQQAVISVGKNTFGHPTQETLDMLARQKIIIRRTDLEGDVIY